MVLHRLTGWFIGDEELKESVEKDDRACNLSSHDYNGQMKLYGYFARKRFGSKRTFYVEKTMIGSCRKCDKTKKRKKKLDSLKPMKTTNWRL